MAKQHLTSVKIDSTKFDDFKILAIKTKVTFQKLAERATDLYLIDEEFREKIHNHFPDKLGNLK